MRWKINTLGMTLVLVTLMVTVATASSLEGEIKVGGIVKDETAGDLSVIQETSNIHDGFSLSQVKLNGLLGQKNFFSIDLREINQESRRGLFTFRVPDFCKLTLRYNKHQHFFDSAGTVASEREDWRAGLQLTPSSVVRLSADYGRQVRDGYRREYPLGSYGFLGGAYDYILQTGRVGAEIHKGSRAFAVDYAFSDFKDEKFETADRQGGVFSVRYNGSCKLFPDKVSHFLRASFGKQELVNAGTEYTIGTFQYLGVVKPAKALQLKYRFFANRIDDEATGVQTDYLRNDFDATWYNKLGSLFGGYGYVTNDDDYGLTSYNAWRVGASAGICSHFKAKVSYSGSEKTDKEQLTLLKDVESSRFRASIQATPAQDLTLGVAFVDRQREFPLIQVKTQGQRWSAFGRLVRPGWGALNLDYSYSDDQYDDLVSDFQADNSRVSGRVDFEYIEDLRLSAGLTFLDVGKDLDVEKSILSFEGHYDLLKDYFVEVKYNVYNYDDYVLLDRYYTANVVWMNVGYRLSID